MTTNLAPHAEQIDAVLRKLSYQRTITTRVQVLKDNESDLLKKVLIYAYSPYIKFGIKIDRTLRYELITMSSQSGGLDLDEKDVWDTLDAFKNSTASSVAKAGILRSLFPRLNMQTANIVLSILEKTAVVNVSASTVNKAWPDTIPVFSVQLAQKYTDKKVKSFPQYVEIKYDGVRAASVIHPSGEVETLTRTGRPIPAAVYFHDELRRIGRAYKEVIDEPAGRMFTGCVADGELCGDTFNDAVSIFRSDTPATSGSYAIFDLLPMESLTDKAFESDDFEVRRETLRKVLEAAQRDMAGAYVPFTRVALSGSYVANSKEEIWSLYNAARAKKIEGVIVKDPKGKWQRKRSNDWLKIKAEETEDLRVIGAFEGEGEMEGTLGGLIVDRAGVQVRVGSGYTHEVRDQLWGMFLRDLVKNDEGKTDFELVGYLAEVQYQEVTPDGSLRHPVFIRMRRDKDEVNF